MDEKKKDWSEQEDFFATHVISQGKATAKRWFIAWLITFMALVGTNALWIYVFSSYEYVSQDGFGVNTINTGEQEDMSIGTENAD